MMYARQLSRIPTKLQRQRCGATIAAVLAVGAAGGTAITDGQNSSNENCIDKRNERWTYDTILLGTSFTKKCHCESSATLISTATGNLQTRGERLTQQKKPTQLSSSDSFVLEDVYEIIRILGEGAYGMVYHAKCKSNGKAVALKAMPREFTGQTDFEREVAALQLLCNTTNNNNSTSTSNDEKENEKNANMAQQGQDRIVQLYDLHRDEDNYYLAMELVEGGELFDHLIAGGPFSEGLAASFLRQFAEGISYTHSRGLVHADLKPENLLLTTSKTTDGTEQASLKLVDFGCATTHDSSKKDSVQLPAQEFAFGCSFLHMVALGNQFELQRMLMEKPGLVNFRDYDFRTPLHLAASEGHVDICRFLVAKGARINRTDRWGGSPLDDAHRHKHTAVIQYLREQGAKFGNAATQITKFIEAAGAGDIDEVKALLEFGTALDMNQGDYDKRTALHLACSEGRLETVKLLLNQKGVDVDVEDRWGNRPLDDAKRAKQNSADIVKLLKAHGATSKDFRPFASQRKKKARNSADDDVQHDVPTSSGTIVYWPPEMFVKGALPSPAIDMWAAGVIMYTVLTGSHPFDKDADKTEEEIQELIIKVGSSHEAMDEIVFDERVQPLSDSCVELMRQLMHPDPKQRMTSEDFLRHPWIQGLTAQWKKMDKAYEKHLQRAFKTNIWKYFGCKKGGNDEVQLRKIFNTIDIAGNGVLDANEIRLILRSAGESEDAVTKIVASLDFQRHGGKVQGVTFAEFQRLMNEE